jgi:hypothetical protein
MLALCRDMPNILVALVFILAFVPSGEIGFLDTPGVALGVAVADNLALVADEEAGLSVVDVSDPFRPQEVGFLDTSGLAYDLVAFGHLALLADHASGVWVVDFSDPRNPARVSSFRTPAFAYDVALLDNLALVAESLKDCG